MLFHSERFLEAGENPFKFQSYLVAIALLGGAMGLFAYIKWHWVLALLVLCGVVGGIGSFSLGNKTKRIAWVGPVALFGNWALQYYEFYRES